MTTTPTKSATTPTATSGNGKKAAPLQQLNIRRQQVTLRDNASIPNSRMELTQSGGRQIAFDVETMITPVLTSARKRQGRAVQEEDPLIRAFGGLSLDNSDLSPVVVNQTPGAEGKRMTKKKDKTNAEVDEDWVPVEESDLENSETEESVASEEYCGEEDANDLAWGLRSFSWGSSDSDEEDPRFSGADDPFSPERAKGMYEYTVLDSNNGSTQKVKRSARKSLGTAPVRLFYDEPSPSKSTTTPSRPGPQSGKKM